ncbi:MAG TPA: hypothetical protein VK137_12220, partial [Planctomycetaceae bacterium]|nr:hypothetical protein [Planctomycetaceae bacterium]
SRHRVGVRRQPEMRAEVKVRTTLGLQNIDEFVLWGLLGATLSRPNADAMLLATPYWMLKHLGLDTGGSQYAMLRESLVRLTAASYQNTGFYNPETREREYAAFQFLSILLPTIGGAGHVVDNDRCWRIEWNPAFFRFCRASGGNLLFDLDLYRSLTPASRRLFLKLKDRFWRSKRVFLNVDDLTINGLGFSAERPLKKRKYDLTSCLRELLRRDVISLGRGQTDPRDLFQKRGKGSYVVVLYEGAYFRQPLTKRTTSEKNAIVDDPLFEPLQRIGVDEAGIRRLFREFTRGMIGRWVKITDAATHEKPRGFSGFKVSPAAFLIDGIQNNRTPPDWWFAHEKKQQREQWERDKAERSETEQSHRDEYDRARTLAFHEFCRSAKGQQIYEKTFPILLAFHKATDPHCATEIARQATLTRMEREDFGFPEFASWLLTQQGTVAETTT